MVVFAVALFLSGCAPSGIESGKLIPGKENDQRRSLLVGKWYNEVALTDGGRRLELAEMNLDGTFTFHFRWVGRDGRVSDDVYIGRWGIDGPIHFTITGGFRDDGEFVPVDPTDSEHYNAYQIVQLDGSTFRYTNIPAGVEYQSRRVAADFRLPD